MDRELYGKFVSQGLRWRLFEIDEVLAGKECPYRLAPADYHRARKAIAELYAVLKESDFVETSLGRAQQDERFQSFLARSISKPKRRPEK